MKDRFKLISGAVAAGIYLCLIAVILYYFNYRNSEKAAHYVKKNSHVMAVSLAGGSQVKRKETKQYSRTKKREKPKKIRNITSPNKAKQKSKKSKKTSKKVKAKSLFSSIKTPKTPRRKARKKANKGERKGASQKVADAMKKAERRDKGIENKYFASVEEKLRGWPAQANYAGEQISVWLKVYPSGSFEFKIQKLSPNSEFNEALITYLKQLQEIGLGSHHHPKPYQIEVSFEATE